MRPAGILCDLEGTLYMGEAPLPAATLLVPALRRQHIPFRFVTNTTSRSRRSLVAHLASMGIIVAVDEIVTAPLAGAALLRARGHEVVAPFMAGAVLEDLEGLVLQGGTAAPGNVRPTAILLGDLGQQWSFTLLQEAFEYVQAGAEIITCSRDRAYRRQGQLVLDVGPFVAALEYATGAAALLAGKPSPAMYDTAVQQLGLPATERSRVLMIGDDMHSDIAGAQQAGLVAWAVETGKYSAAAAARAGIVPDRVIPGLEALLADLGA